MSFTARPPPPDNTDEGGARTYILHFRRAFLKIKICGTEMTAPPSRARHLRRGKSSRDGTLSSAAELRIDAYYILCSRKEHSDRGRLT